ncbi:hypothetical protein [Domibacillus robiginosus]|uniref:hypothetical protein n=1 Tax=Domibacillus robiginosus TaxID=1071054 RepID=UPI00067BB644|nr:hypothetical protein [Domibacillus robiginosus]
MDNLNMKEILINEFKDDPIYKLCLINKLESHLFTESILEMHTETSYSTVEAGKILGRNDSTIRNHFRSDLIEYIAPERYGKYYRLDYISVFKLQMVFVLMEKAGKGSVDILVEAGIHASELFTSSGIKKPVRPESNDLKVIRRESDQDDMIGDRLNDLEKNLAIQTIQLNMLKYEKDLNELDRIIGENKSSIELIKLNEQNHYLEQRQLQLLSASLNKSFEKKGLFGFIKKPDNLNVDIISKELDDGLKVKKDQIVKEKIKTHQERIEKAEEEKKVIQKSLEIEKKNFEKLSYSSVPKAITTST